jgi:hypothetical protein
MRMRDRVKGKFLQFQNNCQLGCTAQKIDSSFFLVHEWFLNDSGATQTQTQNDRWRRNCFLFAGRSFAGSPFNISPSLTLHPDREWPRSHHGDYFLVIIFFTFANFDCFNSYRNKFSSPYTIVNYNCRKKWWSLQCSDSIERKWSFNGSRWISCSKLLPPEVDLRPDDGPHPDVRPRIRILLLLRQSWSFTG